MKKQIFALQALIMTFALNATAGGVGSVHSCKEESHVLASAPLEVYLPDGTTKKAVGVASLVSRKSVCDQSEYEIIDVQLKLDDQIEPYGLKIKGTITGFENSASLEFRLKEIVNTTETFHPSTYAQTKITHFGDVGRLNVIANPPALLFWDSTQSKINDLISAQSNGQASDDRPLACSLDQAYVTLTKKTNGTDGLSKDLTLTAIFRGPLQLCP